MKKIIILCVAISCLCVTSAYAINVNGYLFFGNYINAINYYAEPTQESAVKYRSGFFVDVELLKVKDFEFSFFNKTTILMDQQNEDNSFHPAGAVFNTGISVLLFETGEIRLEHECWHPIDSAGKVGKYNLLEFRLHF